MEIKINQKDIIYFIGIGGIGMSGIALIMKNLGYEIMGSDLSNTGKVVTNLKANHIKVFKDHKTKNILKARLVVTSSAIKSNNPELKLAKKNKKLIIKRADMLAHILNLKKNIVVSGAHGKTTITSLVSTILKDAKFNPTIVNGGIINSIQTNAELGSSDWAVIEADESDGSFLKFKSHYSIVSNIDYEHLDYYKNFNNLKNQFSNFISKTPLLGRSLVCIDDTNIKKIIKKINKKNYLTYGFSKEANFRCFNVKNFNMGMKFDIKVNLSKKKLVIKNVYLNLIGLHNVLNSTVSFAIGLLLGIHIQKIKKSLKNFKGVQRRMTLIKKINKKLIYDDYAHHPSEIKAVLDACRNNFKQRRIIAIFQPHRFSRLLSLYKKFLKCFNKADQVILCPVYAAGEKSRKISLVKLAEGIIKNSKVGVVICNSIEEIELFIKKNLFSDEVVVAMGAGSISNWIKKISENLKNE